MELKEPTYILAIAESSNLKDAAKKLHISTSALSIYLGNVEKQLGLLLFNRIGKTFIPTDAGKLYIRYATEILSLRNQYECEMQNLIDETIGTIHLGIHHRRALYLIPGSLSEFSKTHPNIELVIHEMTSEEMDLGLASGELDIAITNHRNSPSRFLYELLYRDYLLLILSSHHPVCQTAKPLQGHHYPWIDLTLLGNERMILQKPFQSSRIYVDSIMKELEMTPAKELIIENMETAAQFAAEGLGAAFSYGRYMTHFSYKKPVSCFLFGSRIQTINFYSVRNPQKYCPTYVKQFQNELIRQAEIEIAPTDR